MYLFYLLELDLSTGDILGWVGTGHVKVLGLELKLLRLDSSGEPANKYIL